MKSTSRSFVALSSVLLALALALAGCSGGGNGNGRDGASSDGRADGSSNGMMDVASDTPAANDGSGDGASTNEASSDVGPIPCSGGSQGCYSGPAGTMTTGVCRAGTQSCIGGFFGPCTGEVLPSVESCNGADDDCNGSTDDALGMVTCGVGACASTVAACSNGRPSACVPGTPVPENCGDSVDNDCDGIVNNGCSCTYVAPSGSDTAGTGSAAAPFQTIAHGISMAGTGGLPSNVCVASTSATCGTGNPSTATYAEVITMRDGISVYGGYRYDPTTMVWTRAGGTLNLQPNGTVSRSGCTTVIDDQDDRGVVFPSSVTVPTTLDGFTINARINATGATAAITVDGSTGAIINDNVVNGGGVATVGTGATTYGINVDGTTQRATPRISLNAIVGGTGAVSAGVRSYRSAPVITDHCDSSAGNAYDSAGRCTQWACGSSCWSATVRRMIRGRPLGNTSCPTTAATTGTETYAVRLEDSPGADVSRNSMCSSPSPGDTAGVRISGDATGTVVRANHMTGEGPPTGNTNAVGLWADACAGASPWIVDNAMIAGGSRTLGARADGVRAVGDCHVRIDSNLVIVGGEESANNDAYGVYCARDAASGIASRCTVLNNRDVLGSSAGYPPIAAGVRCDNGGCARIENNTRISARQGNRTFGIILDSTGTVVARNGIDAGCGRIEGIGLLSLNSWARVENNVIGGSRWTGGTCSAGSASAAHSYAVRAVVGTGRNELELHSNDLFAFGTPTACTSHALAFDVDTTLFPAPAGPRGVVRNNLLHAGLCQTSYGLDEMSAQADPRVFENNDLWFGACGTTSALPCSNATTVTALYRDEATTNVTSVAAVNLLSDITAALDVSADPAFVMPNFGSVPVSAPGMPPAIDVRLQAASACRDTGTSAALAPTVDFYNNARPSGLYDIGAFEHP